MEMTSRSLTDLFCMLRNNAIQSRLIYQDQNPSLRQEDNSTIKLNDVFLPNWMHEYEHAQYELKNLCKKMDTLDELQKKHLYKPSLDDTSSEEKKIEELTREITLILGAVHKVIQLIKNQQQNDLQKEKLLRQNIVRTMAGSLQEYTAEFRTLQSTYIEKIKSREQRLNFFDLSNINLDGNSNKKLESSVEIVQSDDIDRDFMKTSSIRTKSESNIDYECKTNNSNILLNTSSRDSQFSLDRMKNFSKEDCKIN